MESPQNVIFFVLRSATVYQYLYVPHRPSNAVYFDAATVQQQPRFKLVPVTAMNVLLLVRGVCAIQGSYNKQ